jgi:hypothetical protein
MCIAFSSVKVRRDKDISLLARRYVALKGLAIDAMAILAKRHSDVGRDHREYRRGLLNARIDQQVFVPYSAVNQQTPAGIRLVDCLCVIEHSCGRGREVADRR